MRPRSIARICLVLCCTALAARAADPDFNRDIKPILSENCYFCHGPDEGDRKAGLRLDTYEGAIALREGVAAIDPDDLGSSELLHRILSSDQDEIMPPPEAKIALDAREKMLLEQWVAAGAEYEPHWAFVAPVKAELVGDGHPIDLLVAKRHKLDGLKPSPQATRSALIRRLTLDLTGLPPRPDEISDFLADASPDAYEKVVDRLLASPAYGERMAWDWLDAARYADSNGYQGDNERTMWPWRDWVIDAFNANLPFDQFTIWQLAGDLLPDATFEQKLATGFLRNHAINGEGGRIPEENRVDYVMDMAETTGTAWLGLTFNCCRCHDHKFDPISQREYFQLSAYFNQTPVDGSGKSGQTAPVLAVPSSEDKAHLAEIAAGIAPPDGGEVPSERRKELEGQRAKIEKGIPKVMVMADMPKPRKTYILGKGSYSSRGDEVSMGTPAVLPPLPDGAPANRLGLARWLVSAENPLTARVVVNRLWQQLFGIGLVKTPEDLGTQGETPRHGELLDHLAVEFREGGWDVKALMRLIVTSATYKQTSRSDGYAADPDNRDLARGPRFRMPSWMLRDSALASSQLLVDKVGGAPVNTYQPSGIWEEASFGKKKYKLGSGDDLYRRSIYTFWRRIVAPPAFFDNADRQTCNVKPFRTNTPLHALYTLNETTFVEAARMLAEGALKAPAKNPRGRLDALFVRILSRPPDDAEIKMLQLGFVQSRKAFAARPEEAKALLAVGAHPRDESLDPVEHAAWTALALAVLNLDETLTKQ